MTKNYLISTGGSGGHVIPATILYEHLVKEANVIISSDKRGLKYLEKDYEFKKYYKKNLLIRRILYKNDNCFYYFFNDLIYVENS